MILDWDDDRLVGKYLRSTPAPSSEQNKSDPLSNLRVPCITQRQPSDSPKMYHHLHHDFSRYDMH